MTIRLFVGLDLPEALRLRLAALSDPRMTGARWTHPDSLHITLYFLGDTPQASLDEIDAALGSIHASAFPLQLAGIGVEASAGKAPRYLWVGVRPLDDSLNALQQEIKSVLGQVIRIKDHRPYKPHITLARFKQAPPDDVLQAYLAAHLGWEQPAWQVEQFELFSSLLLASGARHKIEESYPLHPAPD